MKKVNVNSEKLKEVVNQKVNEKIKSVVSEVKKSPKKEIIKKPKKASTVITKKVKPINPKKAIVKDVVKQQKASIAEKVVTTRDVKYLYPDNIQDQLARKKWRQSVRNEIRKLERNIQRFQDKNSKEYKAADKALKDYSKKVLKPGVDAIAI
jgi:flagellar biosynthesis GTPase FlhF